MKMLLVFPPQWNPSSPYLAVPLLVGQLKAAGCEACALDLNIQFYNHILTWEHLTNCLAEAQKLHLKLSETVNLKYPDAEKNFNLYSVEEQTMLLKYKRLCESFPSGYSEVEIASLSRAERAKHGTEQKYLTLAETIDMVPRALSVLRDSEDFFDAEKLFDAKIIIQQALKIASLPYAPNELIWDNYFSNPLLKMDWKNIDSQCKDSSVNMFIDFFNKTADDIAEKQYGCICITVPDLSQMVSAFTLAKILKERTDANICIGGNYITQNKTDFLNHPEIFSEYCDFLMTGDGELSIVELAKYIDGSADISTVSGIIYKDESGTLVCGKDAPKLKMSDVAFACFDDYDLSQYYSADTVFPFQLGKGCYWGKCEFCDYYYGQQCFDIKSVERVISELRYYADTYSVRHFLFIDEAVPAKYYYELSRAIIAAKLKIYFYSFARLEDDFTPEVFETMYKAGARILLWGYECYSPRVLARMNKGINASSRDRILRDSHNAGIWNNALFIIGYPTEKLDEIHDTLNFIRSNRGIVNSCTPSNFSLKKNALMIKDVGHNGVMSCDTNGEFYTVCKDTIDGITQQQRRDIRRAFHYDFISENRRCLWPVVYSDFDHVLPYLSKYGLKYVSDYRSERNICPMFR